MPIAPHAPHAPHDHSAPGGSPEGSIKETLISVVISFVMALIFRSFVVEAFIIPTGSMAPTLMGAHLDFRSSQSGFEWAVNPWYELQNSQGVPAPIQGQGVFGAPTATDPLSTGMVNAIDSGGRTRAQHGHTTAPIPMPTRAGDRIVVEKFLYELFPPKRFDVVVFKNPEDASQNFIKRLIGLPNEQVWIADGDLFTRPTRRSDTGVAIPTGDWRIARKPDRVLRATWWPLYSSEYVPLNPVRDGRRWFTAPWSGEGWQTEDRRDYRNDSPSESLLVWDTARWPITNWTPYNEMPQRVSSPRGREAYPVADLRLTAGVRPDTAGLSMTATLISHGHEFRALLSGGSASIQMRAEAPGSASGLPWRDLATARLPAGALAPGRVTNLEFWRVDQALQLRIDGERVAYAEYDWSPSDRLLYATGAAAEEYPARTSRAGNALIHSDTYARARPRLFWSFSGAPVTLTRVGLYRDIYYEAAHFNMNGPGLATYPGNPADLGPDQFFVLGDNSPSSKDGRLWEIVDPAVAEQIDPTVGIVPRKLLLGKAFLVYFPAPFSAGGRIPIPNFGEVRFIR